MHSLSISNASGSHRNHSKKNWNQWQISLCLSNSKTKTLHIWLEMYTESRCWALGGLQSISAQHALIFTLFIYFFEWTGSYLYCTYTELLRSHWTPSSLTYLEKDLLGFLHSRLELKADLASEVVTPGSWISLPLYIRSAPITYTSKNGHIFFPLLAYKSAWHACKCVVVRLCAALVVLLIYICLYLFLILVFKCTWEINLYTHMKIC